MLRCRGRRIQCGRNNKRDGHLSGSVIIMLTSSGLRGDAARCRELGIQSYLPKPVKRSDLLEAINAALGAHVGNEEAPALVTQHSLRKPAAVEHFARGRQHRDSNFSGQTLREERAHGRACWNGQSGFGSAGPANLSTSSLWTLKCQK